MDTGLIRPYSVIQWRCQWSAFRGWPSHSMCSRPHFTGKPDWPRAENCLMRAGSKASAVSRFHEKLSPANGVQGITVISRKIALLGVMTAKLSKWVAKKWGPTCDCDISDSAIYTTAIYRAYTVSHMALWWQWQNADQTLNSQQAPYTSPSRASYGLSVVRISEKIDCIIKAPYCIVKWPNGIDIWWFPYKLL